MRQDVLDTLQGEVTGKSLVSLWQHYPRHDHSPRQLSTQIISDFKRIPQDLIKISPHGRYAVQDWGCEIRAGTTTRGSDGSSKCTTCRIQSPSDWVELERIDPNSGALGDQVKMVRGVADGLRKTPKMMTVFSPTMVARKLSNNSFPEHLQDSDHHDDIVQSLEMISDVTTEFAKACIDSGADGIFVAVQEADKSVIPDEQISTLLDMNQSFMDEVNKAAEFTVLHLHGEDLAFEKAVNQYSPTAVNWHDQTTGPSIEKAHEVFKGGLLGGLDPEKVLERDVSTSLREAGKLKKELPLILAPGCVLLQGTETRFISNLVKEYRYT